MFNKTVTPAQPMPSEEPAAAAIETPTGPVTDMRELFELAFQRHASDIHLTEHTPPIFRVHGELMPTLYAPLSRADTKRLIFSLLADRQKAQFERDLELDLSIDVQGLGRFRINVHLQRGSVEAAFRLVPKDIRSLGELGLQIGRAHV